MSSACEPSKPDASSRDACFDDEFIGSKKSAGFQIFSWWASCFRTVSKLGGHLASFMKSFQRRTATPVSAECTARLWPMPLPYPAAMSCGAVSSDDTSWHRGVNLAIGVLDWLFLRRPMTCPAECVLFQPLSRLQWKVVRHIEATMGAWKKSGYIEFSSLGRAASKVEEIEKLLCRLEHFEDGIFSTFGEAESSPSGSPWGNHFSRRFAFGLHRAFAGEVVGHLSSTISTVAKPLKADRLEFRGTPQFNPSPFLDERGRKIFETPMQAAQSPSDILEDPPLVRLFGSDSDVWQVLRKLDSTNRLGALKEHEVYMGYQAGLFSIQKDEAKDRMIFDSRPFNILETPPGRWVASMASADNLTDMHIEPGSEIRVTGTDLREFYYSFLVTRERLARNSLMIKTDRHKLRGFNCLTPEFADYDGPIWLGLRTLAMGDSCAVEIAQTAHVGILFQMGLLREDNMVGMKQAIPRGPSMVGVVIDDLILFETVLQSLPTDAEVGKPKMERALQRFSELGLIPHLGKTFFDTSEGEFWGSLFEGKTGYARASLKRAIPILFATVGILKLGVVTRNLLEVLVGCWTSCFLFRRRLLSLLNIAYQAVQAGEDRSEVLRLSSELQDELLMIIALAPLTAAPLRSKNSGKIFASDASTWGWAIIEAPLPSWMVDEVHRHKLRKSIWTKLLSPLKQLERSRGVLPLEEELPGDDVLSTHPLWVLLASSLQFVERAAKPTKEGRHINLDELEGMLEVEKAAAFDDFPSRYFSLADSQVSLGALLKGRSSSLALNEQLQKSLPVHLGCGMVPSYGFLPSAENPADDPTRKVPLRAPSRKQPDWLDPASSLEKTERLRLLDIWLKEREATPWELSGLPPLTELAKDGCEDLCWKSSERRKDFWARKRHKVSNGVGLHCIDFEKFAEVGRSSTTTAAIQGADLNSYAGMTVPSKQAEQSMSSSGARPEQPPDDFLRERFSNSVDDKFSFPTAASLGVERLSKEAMQVLRRVPRKQFKFPSHWVVPDDWVPDFAGYVDLFSGKKGVAASVVKLAETWAITFEIEDGLEQDLLLDTSQQLVEDLVVTKAVHTLGAAIVCGSFSRAVRPAVRSRSRPFGFPNLSFAMKGKVDVGNRMASWLMKVLLLCRKFNIHYWIENPDLSFLWDLPEWIEFGSKDISSVFRFDQCACGCPWRKRTRLLTSLHLAGQRIFCSRNHKHIRLVGWAREHRMPWTRVAQTYPRRLCHWISVAILVDAGLLPNRRKLDIAAICRANQGRIGEAKNPGPRRANVVRRPLRDLVEAELVEPHTAILGERVWTTFHRWCLRYVSEEAFVSLSSQEVTIGPMVEAFGKFLFAEGQSIYILRQLVTYIQRHAPRLRGGLVEPWQLIQKWERIEPMNHRTPMPRVIYQAMVATALLWGWYKWSGICVLAFEGLCRPGEPLAAFRSDLLLSSDFVVEDPATVFLRIANPKGRRRGVGLVQHTKISDLAVAKFLQFAFGNLNRSERLYGGSPSSFRKRWDLLLKFLMVPTSLGLTPASLRSGGAIHAYRSNQEIAKILWRMRIRHQDTLQHYLQEMGAASIFSELPSSSRKRIQHAAVMYPTLLAIF